MSAIAIIPARGGSKRLPRKNIMPFAGKPMIAHPITTALESGLFNHVVVSTEDLEIADISREYGATVIKRPNHLAEDISTVAQVCLHALGVMKERKAFPDVFCRMFPTTVLITPDDLIQSLKLLCSSKNPDVILSVSEYIIHPYKAMVLEDGFLKPLWPEMYLRKSQYYPSAVASNGSFFWAKTNAFVQHGSVHVKRMVGYPIPPERAVDIDTQEDFDTALRLFHHVRSRSTC